MYNVHFSDFKIKKRLCHQIYVADDVDEIGEICCSCFFLFGYVGSIVLSRSNIQKKNTIFFKNWMMMNFFCTLIVFSWGLDKSRQVWTSLDKSGHVCGFCFDMICFLGSCR